MTNNQNTSANSLSGSSDKDMTLRPSELRMLTFLKEGGRWSARNLMLKTGDRDPRSTIRYLIGKGIPVASRWVKEKNCPRYKQYFIHQES